MSDRVAVSVDDVDFSYDGLPVREGASVTVQRGDLVGVVGPNGGGKTTLLKLVLGLLQPSRGRVLLLGERPERSRHRVGYVPQSHRFDPSFPVTVLDVVLMGRLGNATPLGPYRRRDRAAALDALETVGLSGLAGRSFSALSGGQRQRVLIGRALAGDPDLLLLDEPTAGVDAAAERSIHELLRALNARMTIVMVTHDLGFVSGLMTSVLCVNRRVVWHPTLGIDEVTPELLAGLYGADARAVRHDVSCPTGEPL